MGPIVDQMNFDVVAKPSAQWVGALRQEEIGIATIIQMETPNSNHQKITTRPRSFHLPQNNPNRRRETKTTTKTHP